MTIEVTERIIDRQTGQRAAGLLIELWDRKVLAERPLATSRERTNTDGFFQLEATVDLLTRLCERRLAGFFFRLIKEVWNTPIEVAAREARWHMDGEQPPVEVWIALLPIEDSTHRVAGQVNRQDGSHIHGVIVRAFDQDLSDAEPLGEAVTDAYGIYAIVYSADRLRRFEKCNASHIVRAYDSDGTKIGASEVKFNAPAEAKINLVVELHPKSDLSEYEQFLAGITPILEGVPLADLTDHDFVFLHGKTRIARDRLEYLLHATQLSRQTDLPGEVFYAFARYDLPSDLKSLLSLDIDTLRGMLETAIKHRMIPARLFSSLSEIVGHLSRLKTDYIPTMEVFSYSSNREKTDERHEVSLTREL